MYKRQVIKEENFTDHNDITFKLESEKVIIEKTRKWDNADWDIFTTNLAKQHLPTRKKINEKRLDTMVSKVYSTLNRALDLACPKTVTKIVDKNNPWWTDKHQEARKQLSKLYKTKQRKPSERNIVKYKKAKTEYAKLCRNSQEKDG